MWSDRETDIDFLGYSSYVEVLAQVAVHPQLAPLALGIFGSWGSGKSSLMRMLKKAIDDSADDTTMTLWFNAWRYEGKEEAQSALIHAIVREIEAKRSPSEEAKAFIKKVVNGASILKVSKFIYKTVTTLTPDIEGFLALFENESKKLAETMEAFDEQFSELLD
jgi:predicted KAP-like P-loop ATPase